MWECLHAKLLHQCPTLCDPMDCSPPGSSVHGTLQARVLEWVAMASSRGSYLLVILNDLFFWGNVKKEGCWDELQPLSL